MTIHEPTLERDAVVVRRLRPDDFDRVVHIDELTTGERREEFFRVKLEQAISQVGTEVSLAAEVDGILAGFLIVRIYYGEFGVTERVAMLDVLGVDPKLRGQGVGRALLRQLRTNLLGLGVNRLATTVGWDDVKLLSFFHHEGFEPAPRICVELDLAEHRRREELAEAF